MKVVLELARIILIFGILGSLLGQLLMFVYGHFSIPMNSYKWLGGIGIYLLLFILYRNKWQFSGYYTGKGIHKLSRPACMVLYSTALALIIGTPIMGYTLEMLA
ncbi:hypothetical protein [Bacillus testis]|uniref:hypothetical protein n=1 Tax=Bacillus testis TaxID=1622072 RepID=UPI00067F2E74|nr:hypothetical protein [Bacillus testis]